MASKNGNGSKGNKNTLPYSERIFRIGDNPAGQLSLSQIAGALNEGALRAAEESGMSPAEFVRALVIDRLKGKSEAEKAALTAYGQNPGAYSGELYVLLDVVADKVDIERLLSGRNPKARRFPPARE